MKTFNKVPFLLTIVLLINCSKESLPEIRSNQQFVPFGSDEFFLDYAFHPLLTESSLIIPVVNNLVDQNKINKFLNVFNTLFCFDLSTNQIIINHQEQLSNSFGIYQFMPVNANCYIGVSGKEILKFNKDFELVKRENFPSTVGFLHGIIMVNQNTFIVYYMNTNLEGFMSCFDLEINEKWTKQLSMRLPNYNVRLPNKICVSHNAIYIVETIPDVDHSFYITQYDINGNFVQSISSKAGRSIGRIIPSDKGFIVYSIYISNLNTKSLSVTSFDSNCSLLKEKILSVYPTFSKSDFIDYNLSNIVKQGNDYYCSILIDKECKLMKINANLEIDWVKPLDKQRLGEYEILCSNDKNIISIGKSSWGGIKGFSIIKTDLEGNIQK